MSNVLSHEILDFEACILVGKSIEVKPLSMKIHLLWDQVMSEGLLENLEKLSGRLSDDMIGGETQFNGTTFTYTAGYFFKEGSKIPGDYDVVKIPSCKILHTVVEGISTEIFVDAYGRSVELAKTLGLTLDQAKDFCAEVYTEKFIESSEEGNLWVLDHYLPIL